MFEKRLDLGLHGRETLLEKQNRLLKVIRRHTLANDRVWCIDVGIADYYGGRTEVLEIRGDVVRSRRRKAEGEGK